MAIPVSGSLLWIVRGDVNGRVSMELPLTVHGNGVHSTKAFAAVPEGQHPISWHFLASRLVRVAP